MMRLLALQILLSGVSVITAAESPPTIRIATYNVAFHRNEAGKLSHDLQSGTNRQAGQIAEVIQRIQPDILLLNEFDYDDQSRALDLFEKLYLGKPQADQQAIEFAHRYVGTVNTGRPTRFDLNRDGKFSGPADAVGFGHHEGQYGMAVLSKFPFSARQTRTFQRFLWADMPGALLPVNPSDESPYYSPEELQILRLSSKSFWDLPILVDGPSRSTRSLHLLCAHPTPPVFDGPEDRNGRRNHDELRMIADYLDPQKSDYLVDDNGQPGGLNESLPFVIAGDLNADPVDGDSLPGAINQLLNHRRVDSSWTPSSAGSIASTPKPLQKGSSQRGNPAHHTASFGRNKPRNYRVDYLLPSRELVVVNGGVFWPRPEEPGGQAVTASDHRLVWLDINWRQ
jgi:endonuclease/exonuclease/phosphatase family metal-dependent hydrolase